MNNKWTKFNNVLIWVSIVAWLIAVIVLTSKLSSFELTESYAWIVGLVGTLVVFAAHALWGLFIEMSKNIMIMSVKPLSNSQTENIQSTGEQPVQPNNTNSDWICRFCKSTNPRGSQFCQNCGHRGY